MIDKPIILDDAISKRYQKELETLFLSSGNLPWYYQQDITYSPNTIESLGVEPQFGFSHLMYDDLGNVKSRDLFNIVLPLVYEACDKINYDFKRIGRARSFLQTPTRKSEYEINHPHVDLPHPHLVLLYYVNDSDGDTVLFNETYEDIPESDVSLNKLNEMTRCSPKQGRVLFFNGKHYHSSSRPLNKHRCIINVDIF